MLPRLLGQGAILAVAFVGGLAAATSGVPAGWMSGAMVAVTAFAATGRAKPFLPPLRDFVIVLTGVSMGSGATPDALGALLHYPLSIVTMAVAVGAMTASAYAVLSRSPGFSRATALFASIPGALSYVFVAAQGTTADMPRVAITQVFRLFVLMAVVPLLASRLGASPPPSTAFDPALTTLVLAVCSFALAFALTALKIAPPYLYAAIGVSALAHATGIAPGRPDPTIQLATQVLVGGWVGTRFIGFDWSLLRSLIWAAFGAFAAALAAAAAFAALSAALTKAPYVQVLVAFAPGGLEAMTMMAFALGLDPMFVGAHHLARFLLISLALPLVARLVAGTPPPAKQVPRNMIVAQDD